MDDRCNRVRGDCHRFFLGEGCRTVPLSGHVGFDSLPDQLVNKSVNHGFCFNILCVGETGLGKSTLMDTLFNTKFEGEPASHSQPGVQLKSSTYDLQESNVGLKLTVVGTVGFGDQINKEDSYKPIVEFIDAQFEAYLQEELKIKRVLHNFHDSRIHACLYFIAPTGHSLKSLDLVTMKKLDSKVNIIPIIAKSDAISKSELTKFKIKITSELVSNGVQIYQFPTDDESVAEINGTMNAHLPFAVIGSTEELKIGNKMMKARQYPWGTVQVENETHCDFVKLREMLIRVNMEDLREQTHTRHYELYRRCKLEEMGFKDTDPDSKPFSCTKSLIVSRSCIRMKKRSWRTRRNLWTMKSMRLNRGRRQLNCSSLRPSRLEDHRLLKGKRREKTFFKSVLASCTVSEGEDCHL
uniref:Septin 6 n=1 Tax=Chrysemys picta bellii TaxID=8478 RepID=A0A8C3I945_CHRPI